MNTKIKIGICAGIIFIIAAAAVCYNFYAKTTTPEYALKIVEESIANHDKEKFYKHVDLKGILETSYDGIIEGMTYTNKAMTPDARESVKDFTEMLRAPLLLSLESSIDSYVATGDFHEEDNVGVSELLKRTGMDKSIYRGIGEVVENDSQATAKIQIYHPELEREFSLNFILKRDDSDVWKIIRVENFKEFITQINQVRRKKLDNYLNQSAEIISRHEKIVADAMQKYNAIVGAGSLANEDTRAKLRDLMSDVVKKDWETRKVELLKLTVPQDAATLQNLRLKICDLEIAYAEGYAKWMDDKNAATVKTAEENHRQAQTLTLEAKTLASRMVE